MTWSAEERRFTARGGRPLPDLHRKFDDPHLDADVRAVLAKLVPKPGMPPSGIRV